MLNKEALPQEIANILNAAGYSKTIIDTNEATALTSSDFTVSPGENIYKNLIVFNINQDSNNYELMHGTTRVIANDSTL